MLGGHHSRRIGCWRTILLGTVRRCRIAVGCGMLVMGGGWRIDWITTAATTSIGHGFAGDYLGNGIAFGFHKCWDGFALGDCRGHG
jgi:hypothetical protein